MHVQLPAARPPKALKASSWLYSLHAIQIARHTFFPPRKLPLLRISLITTIAAGRTSTRDPPIYLHPFNNRHDDIVRQLQGLIVKKDTAPAFEHLIFWCQGEDPLESDGPQIDDELCRAGVNFEDLQLKPDKFGLRFLWLSAPHFMRRHLGAEILLSAFATDWNRDLERHSKIFGHFFEELQSGRQAARKMPRALLRSMTKVWEWKLGERE
jgi:hypothetical protein